MFLSQITLKANLQKRVENEIDEMGEFIVMCFVEKVSFERLIMGHNKRRIIIDYLGFLR